MGKNIGYHTRLDSDNQVKVVGGSFGGSIDAETVARLVKAHFKVRVKNSGRCVFVDRSEREVSLYISVDASTTEEGKQALLAHSQEENRRAAAESAAREEIMDRIFSMSTDQIRDLLRLAGELPD